MITSFKAKKAPKICRIKDMVHKQLYRLVNPDGGISNCVGVCIHNYWIVLHNPTNFNIDSIVHDTSNFQFVALESGESITLTQE